jgi:hypothetical protein
MTLSQLSSEQIGQLDLADLTFDFGVRHSSVEIMLKSGLAQQNYKKLLCEVDVSVMCPFFNQQAGTFRCPNKRMMTDDPVKFRPEAAHVGGEQILEPVSGPQFAVV